MILVTGATGHIGGQVASLLIQQGEAVCCLALLLSLIHI